MDKQAIVSAYEQLRTEFKDFLDFNFDETPFIKYCVEENYNPKKHGHTIGCLIIAESPPHTGYFYDDEFPHKNGLRFEIFHLLNSLGLTIVDDENGLNTFRDHGYLLIDAIKLRIKTKKLGNMRLFDGDERERKLVVASADLLSKEIEELKPQKIWLIGNKAKNVFLEAFQEYENEKDYVKLAKLSANWKVNKNMPKAFRIGRYKVVFTRFPRYSMNIWKRQTKFIKKEIVLLRIKIV